MAKKNKIIKFKDGDGNTMTINTKRLDSIYLSGKTIYFVFSKRSIDSREYETVKKADHVRLDIVKEWMGLS